MNPMKTLPLAAVVIGALAITGTAAPASAHDMKSHGATETAASAETKIEVTGAWARPTIAKMRITAAYFHATLAGTGADKLIAAKTPLAGRAELHEHVMQGDVAKMRPVDAVPLAPGKPVVFQPGGYHVMIMDLKQALNEGDTFPLTLTFEKAGDVTVDVMVSKKGGGMGHGNMDHGNMDHGKMKH
jgi:copper(I)-binding protein